MNKVILFSLVIIGYLLFCSIGNAQEQCNIITLSEDDLFIDLPISPELLSDNSSFTILEKIPHEYSYSKRSGAELEVIVKGIDIEILYWKIGKKFQIHRAEIIGNTISTQWGELINASIGKILDQFGTPTIIEDNIIKYEKTKFYIYFTIFEGQVERVVIGKQI